MADTQESGLLDTEALRRLLKNLGTTDVDELEIEIGTSRLYLRREPGKGFQMPGATAAEETRKPPAVDGVTIAAPLTGVFYSKQSPDQPPYVSTGDAIEVGQVVALIETMKLFNEVTSEVGGQVMSVTAKDGDAVQEGQVLFVIKPLSTEVEQ